MNRAVRVLPVLACRSLVRRRLQSVLLLVALTVALAGTMTIMAVLSGLQAQVGKDLRRVGVDVVNVQVKPELGALLGSPLHMRDTRWMQEEVPGGQLAPMHVQLGLGSRGREGERSEVLLLSTTSAWNEIVPLQKIEGRFFR